jgi:hypothetical protein
MRSKETRKAENTILTTIGVLLIVVAVCAVLIVAALMLVGEEVTDGHSYGITTSWGSGEAGMTVVEPGNLDSMQLIAPSGTQSTVMSRGIQSGMRITVRSNSTVYSYLENNSVKIPAEEGGFTTIEEPDDLTSTNLLLQRGNLSDTDYTRRSAYLACLYENGGFSIDGQNIPSNVSVPCHTPVLAQNDSVQPGTSTEIAGDIITTPILLEEGEYRLFGTIGDEEGIIQSMEVSEEVAGQ